MRRRKIACWTVFACVLAMVSVARAGKKVVKITPEWKEKMKALMPEKPGAAPEAKRKVLLFSLTTGYKHWVVPHTSFIVKALAEKTGAFEVVESKDVHMFERDKLKRFDGVILNNNCSKGPGRNIFLDALGKNEEKAEELEKNLIDFVSRGNGLTAIHGAIVFLNNSEEFSSLLGASFAYHPAQQKLTLNLVEPGHRLLRAFEGKPLVHVDEPYIFKGAYAEKNFRPLLVMDTSGLKCGNREKQIKSDVRYCAWIKKHGKGRVFYCSPSHNAQSFEDPRLLQFLLDGIQYTLGDLECDDRVEKAASRRPGPPEEGKWKPVPELTDEFNGETLDSSKWHDHNPKWRGRKPGLFSKKNVTVSGGRLHLTARAEDLPEAPNGYHSFTTAAVKSKKAVRYGYFELRCKPMRSRASSAFWFYRNTEKQWTEIDVFEICGVGDKWKRTYNMNVHVFHTPEEDRHWSKGGKWKAPFDFAEDYHVYALLWDKDNIKWYVDGKVVRTLKNTHWHQALHMNFDSETMPDWFGLPKKKNLPSTFSIDYIRSWKTKTARLSAHK